VLYACDGEWWDRYYRELNASCCVGELWTQDAVAARRYNLDFVPSEDAKGISLDPSKIHQGGNSAFQAMNLAALWGASRIEFYGLDLQGQGHWFGEHPPELRRGLDFERCIRAFKESEPQLKSLGIEVVNHSPGSAVRFGG
jgi:hypothetical protein